MQKNEVKMDGISKTMDSAFKTMDESFKTMDDTMNKMEKHFDDLSDAIETKLNNEVDEIIKDAKVVKVVKETSSEDGCGCGTIIIILLLLYIIQLLGGC